MPDQLDQLLNDHFTRELEPHVGRSREAFLAHASHADTPRRVNWWWLPTATGAVAAAAIALVTLMPASPAGPGGPATSPIVGPQLVEQRVSWDTINGGTVFDGPVPYHRVVREEVETQRYHDPATNTEWEIILPRKDVTYIRAESY